MAETVSSLSFKRLQTRSLTTLGIVFVLVILILAFDDKLIGEIQVGPTDLLRPHARNATSTLTTAETTTTTRQEQQNETITPINEGNATRIREETGQELADNASDTTRASSSPPLLLGTKENPATLVIQLSGEMANQLSKLSHGYGLHRWLQDDYHVSTKLVLRHQENSKWIKARESVQLCFATFRTWDFEAANTREFLQRQEQQKTWLGNDAAQVLSMSGNEYLSKEAFVPALNVFVNALNQTHNDRPRVSENATVTLPFLYTDVFGNSGDLVDRYISELRDLFAFDQDKPECCQERAAPDESVFHFRGFLKEMPRVAPRRGFTELSPNKTANELFSHLTAGDKVAITSRFQDQAQDYAVALKERGIISRVISGQSGTQDFCFLLSAEKELAGMVMSTYVIWASLLGNATRARLYSVKTPVRVKNFGQDGWFFRTNYSSPQLRDKIVYEPYLDEEMEKEEAEKAETLSHGR